MATDDKYDRQLRLWGSDGQRRLAESHVLLINATPTGTEALKNLILPGIGQFSVADNALTTFADHGNNFFVTAESIGKPRADITTELLAELNPDSKAHSLNGCGADTFIKDPAKLSPYTLIIACDLSEREIVELGKTCTTLGKPLIISSSFGLLGYIRLYKPEHTIIESKPVEQVEGDLRLARPFPELLDFAASFDLGKLEDAEHKHVPFPVLLIKAKDLWKQTHDGKLPGNFKEKEEFTKMVKNMSRDFYTEENFQEAVAHAPQCFVSNEVRGFLRQVLDDPKCDDKIIKDKFWVMAGTLKRFYTKYGDLPLNGKIPDITADTMSYLRMQKIYEEKALKDLELFREILREVEKERGLPVGYVTDAESKHFCENNRTIMCIRFSDIAQEFTKAPNADTLKGELGDSESLIPWYFLVRASLRYHGKHGMYPAEKIAHEKYLEEYPAYKTVLDEVIKEIMGKDSTYTVDEKLAKEMLRYSNSKIHNVGSIIGGIVAQEAIKLITHIFSPFENTLIFEGASSKISVYNL